MSSPEDIQRRLLDIYRPPKVTKDDPLSPKIPTPCQIQRYIEEQRKLQKGQNKPKP